MYAIIYFILKYAPYEVEYYKLHNVSQHVF